jgi:hypothetical protein
MTGPRARLYPGFAMRCTSMPANIDPVPDITVHPLGTREKYGFGINTE